MGMIRGLTESSRTERGVTSGALRRPRRPMVALLPAAILALFLSMHQTMDVDLWWQLRTGELIVQGPFPRTDQLSYTQAGTPRIESSWLYHVALAWLQPRIGFEGLTLLKSAVVLATLWIAAGLAAARAPPALIAVISPLAVIACSQRFVMRPEVISTLAFVWFLYVLDKEHARGRTRLLWTLPAAQLLWANTHSLYPLGVALAGLGAILAAADPANGLGSPVVRRRVGVACWCVVACFVTPYHWVGVLVPIDQFRSLLPFAPSRGMVIAGAMVPAVMLGASLIMVGRRWKDDGPERSVGLLRALVSLIAGVLVSLALLLFAGGRPLAESGTEDRRFIAELAPTLTFPNRLEAIVAYKVLLGIVVAGLIAPIRRRDLFIAAGTLLMIPLSLLAVRNIPFGVWPALALVLRTLPAALQPLANRRVRHAPRLAFAAVSLFASVWSWRIVTDRFHADQGDVRRFGIGVCELSIPRPAADALSGVERVFNTQSIGSYLAWRRFGVFIDSRASGSMITEMREIISSDQLGPLESARQRYGFTHAVIDLGHTGFIARLASDPGWTPVMIDHAAVVFQHGPAEMDRPLQLVLGALPEAKPRSEAGVLDRVASPHHHRQVARALFVLGRFDDARRSFELARALDPSAFKDWSGLGYCLERSGDLAGAGGAYAAAADIEPPGTDGRSRLLLQAAEVYIGAGRHEVALGLARRAYSEDMGSDRSASILGAALVHAGRPFDAVPLLARVAGRRPTPDVLSNLAVALVRTGRSPEAEAPLLRAAELDPGDPRIARDLADLYLHLRAPERAAFWTENAIRIESAQQADRPPAGTR